MFYVYLACLIFGGILLIVSLFGGGDHAVEHDLDVGHGDAGLSAVDVETGAEIDLQADHDIGGHDFDAHDAGQSGSGDAIKFLSFRNIIYFLAFFGLTGTVMEFFPVNFFFTLVSSLGIGALAYFAGYQFFKYLKNSETGETISTSDLRGRKAKVLVGISKERDGKILVEVGGATVQLLARASDVAKADCFSPGEEVLIIDTSGSRVYVVNANLLNK